LPAKHPLTPWSPSSYGLALHTASADLGLAISNFSGDRRCQTWALGRDLASYLHLHLVEFLQPQTWQDLAFLAVARGPGGFTGTRIGVVTARALAQQLDIPVFGISTLAAAAWQARELAPEVAIAVQMRAQRGELFCAIYQPTAEGLQPILPDTVLPPDQWRQKLEQQSQPHRLLLLEEGLAATVANLLELAYLDWQRGKRPHWSEVLPFYGQHPVNDRAEQSHPTVEKS